MKDIWKFLWESDSPWSWIADFVLAFLMVRFIFFPIMGLVLSTSLPLVVVESCSMEHGITNCGQNTAMGICGNVFDSYEPLDFEAYWGLCGKWYEDRNISESQFKGYSFSNGFNKGDIILVKGSQNYERGDVIIFGVSEQSTPIIHRIVYQNEDLSFATKGDHNGDQLTNPDEKHTPKNRIIGKALLKVPYLGWIKLFFVDLIRKL